MLDVSESSLHNWGFMFTDGNGNVQTLTTTPENGLLTVDLSSLTINKASISQLSIGATAPLDTSYTAIIDYLRDDSEATPPPEPPVGEPTPLNTSDISVTGNEIAPLQKACVYPWFLDTPSGWFPRIGEAWSDSTFARWDETAVRAVLRDMRENFGFNTVRLLFWMDSYLTNSKQTMSTYVPAAEIGLADALHRFVEIAREESLLVELRMWDWNIGGGRTTNPLTNHTSQEFIDAWVKVASDFARYSNVFFNLFDEPDSIGWETWKTLAYNTIMAIRNAGIGHAIYVHWKYCGGEGIDWIRQFGNHYQVAFSRHEYIQHGTTEAMHSQTIQIKNEGYPITMTASGVYNLSQTQIETYRIWLKELLDNNIGIGVYTYGRPYLEWSFQQNTTFPCLPNAWGKVIQEIIGVSPTYTLSITASAGGTTNPQTGNYLYNQGTVASVTAQPASNYHLDHWELDRTNAGTSNPISVTMNADHTLQAIFEAETPIPPTGGCMLYESTRGTVFIGYLPTIRRFRDRCLSKEIQAFYYSLSKYLAPKIRKLRRRDVNG